MIEKEKKKQVWMKNEINYYLKISKKKETKIKRRKIDWKKLLNWEWKKKKIKQAKKS